MDIPAEKQYEKRRKTVKCPVCGEVVENATIINGRLRGWCGVMSEFVNEEVGCGKDKETNT